MDDFEELLRRFRPAGPPAELRQRVVAAAQHESERAVARPAREPILTAAVIVLTMIFYWLAANERRIVGAMFTPVPPIDQAAADLVDSEEPQP